MKLCPECKKELVDDAKFCKYCGLSLNEDFDIHTNNAELLEPAAVSQKFEKKDYTKIIIIAVAAVLVVGAIVAGIIFLPDLFNKGAGEETSTKEGTTEVSEEGTTEISEENTTDEDEDERPANVDTTDSEDGSDKEPVTEGSTQATDPENTTDKTKPGLVPDDEEDDPTKKLPHTTDRIEITTRIERVTIDSIY